MPAGVFWFDHSILYWAFKWNFEWTAASSAYFVSLKTSNMWVSVTIIVIKMQQKQQRIELC